MKEIPKEWLAVKEIKEAVALAEESALSKAELAGYEKYWDAMSTEKMFLGDAKMAGFAEGKAEGKAEGLAEGKAEGLVEGEAKGKAEGLAEGEAKGKVEGANAVLEAMLLLKEGKTQEETATLTGLPLEQVHALGVVWSDIAGKK